METKAVQPSGGSSGMAPVGGKDGLFYGLTGFSPRP